MENSKAGKKWASVFTKSGRSFEREERMGAVDLESMTYDELLKYHKEADKQFTDWRVLGTRVNSSSSRLEQARCVHQERNHPPRSVAQVEQDFRPIRSA
ncbi:MAG: hypothetical protein R3F17_16775 [Planctomycetota bacterium]